MCRRVGRLDRRRREIELTDAGRVALAEVRRVRLDHLRQLLSGWPDTDLARLHELLGRFNASVRDVPERLWGAT